MRWRRYPEVADFFRLSSSNVPIPDRAYPAIKSVNLPDNPHTLNYRRTKGVRLHPLIKAWLGLTKHEKKKKKQVVQTFDPLD